MMMKERNYNYDILRIVACLMIVCMHAPMVSEGASGVFLSAVSYFTAPGLCMFFLLSGALILPVKGDTFAFLKKRLKRVVGPTVCFSIFYMFLNATDGCDVNWWRSVCSIPFSAQGHGVLWFMYTLMGLYLLSPVISRWLEVTSKKELEFYLCLWGVTLCYPLLSLFVDVNMSETGILYYFSGYGGYFVLGHYLRKYPESLSLKKIAIPTIIAVLSPVVCKLTATEVDFYSMFWYLSVFVAILTVAMFRLFTVKEIRIEKGSKMEKFITTTSGLSFGIYLMHIAVMRYGLWRWDWIAGISNYYLQWVVIVVLTFVVSLGICYVVSRMPGGRYVVGSR